MDELDAAGADAGVEEGPLGRSLAPTHSANVTWNVYVKRYINQYKSLRIHVQRKLNQYKVVTCTCLGSQEVKPV